MRVVYECRFIEYYLQQYEKRITELEERVQQEQRITAAALGTPFEPDATTLVRFDTDDNRKFTVR